MIIFQKIKFFSLNLSPSIKFKASSFAKPFGGRFGPQPTQGDPLIPHHQQPGNPSIPSGFINPALLQPNYSRWPGDKWGLIDTQLHDKDLPSHFLRKKNTGFPQSYFIGAFFHLILDNSADDPLARPSPHSVPSNELKKNFMRMMELMAVYPDVFDLSHYSIAGNYMKTYFPRICKLLTGRECIIGRNPISDISFEAYIRGDFGWPETDHYMKLNQDKKEVDISVAPYFLQATPPNPKIDPSEITHYYSLPPRPIPPNQLFPALTKGDIFYPWLAQELPAHLLSSWAPTELEKRYTEYKFPENKFLKCAHKATKDMPVPSSCAIGGRSDYSVKLISCEAVNDFDPKPGNIDEYCP